MALVPMRQDLIRRRGSGELDIYGKPMYEDEIILKCRAVEGTHTTTDRSSLIEGAVVVAEVKFLLDKLADITYDDELEYTNELGAVFKGKPKSIRILRDIAAKPLMTEVFL
ncbi:hypothetical protein ACE41F_26925 [Bacillus cereus]|uniref:hypothetical protein n=1 Tax=Bacillus cereus TaxID=1396 RepID=UPI0035C96609